MIINESKRTQFDGMSDNEIIGYLQTLDNFTLYQIYKKYIYTNSRAHDRLKDQTRQKKIDRILKIVHDYRENISYDDDSKERPNKITLRKLSDSPVGSAVVTDTDTYVKIDKSWWIHKKSDNSVEKIASAFIISQIKNDPSAQLKLK